MVWSTAVQERNFRGADVRLHSLQSALIRIAGGSCSGSTRNSKQNKTPLLATRAFFILNRNSERRAVFLAASFELAFAAKSGEVFRSEVPVHQVPEMLDILRPCVAVIHVIGMLPHVAGQQRLVSSCQRRAGVGSARDIHRTIRFLDQPSPARAAAADAGFREFFLELVKRSPFLVDRIGQCAARSAAADGLHAVLVKRMVPYLRGIVEYAAGRILDDVFQ